MPRAGAVATLFLAAAEIIAATRAAAAVKGFPYEAIVEEDDAFVRSGPGKNYYPTVKLKRGDHVTVRRHDPGGWFMIDPPAGSFSLIRADDVLPEGNVGIVKRLDQGQASVRVGSAIDPTIEAVFQRKLSTGERVEILGETTIPRKHLQVRMFKIRPPRGEFRWIEGKDLTPVGPQIAQDGTRDPFAPPPQDRKQATQPVQQHVVASPQASAPGGSNPKSPGAEAAPGVSRGERQNGPVHAVPLDPRSRLEQLDLAFRDMVRLEPATWNLAQIEQGYRELEHQSRDPAINSQLEMRLSAVDHYKDVKAEYDDYFRLISETSRKDAELAAIQNSMAPHSASRPAVGQLPGISGQTPTADPGLSSGPQSQPTQNAAPSNGSIPSPATLPNLVLPNPQAPQSIATPQPDAKTPAGPILGLPIPQGSTFPSTAPAPGIQGPNVPTPNLQGPFTPVPTEPGATDPPNNADGRPTHRSITPPIPGSNPPGNLGLAPPNEAGSSIGTGPPNESSRANQFGPQNQSVPRQTGPPPIQQPQSPGRSYPPLAVPRQIRPPGAPPFDGAGIIQRAVTSTPGGPRHVLVAPNGRILAYLQPERPMNLDAYVGHPMGIFGQRLFRPELQADLIVVRGMVPVRLTP